MNSNATVSRYACVSRGGKERERKIKRGKASQSCKNAVQTGDCDSAQRLRFFYHVSLFFASLSDHIPSDLRCTCAFVYRDWQQTNVNRRTALPVLHAFLCKASAKSLPAFVLSPSLMSMAHFQVTLRVPASASFLSRSCPPIKSL